MLHGAADLAEVVHVGAGPDVHVEARDGTLVLGGAGDAVGQLRVPDAVFRLLAAGVGFLAVAVAEPGVDTERDASAGAALAVLVDHVGRAAVDGDLLCGHEVERFTVEDIGGVDDLRGLVEAGFEAGGEGSVLIVELVQRVGIPAIYVFREQAEAGGLMSYSDDAKAASRMFAKQVAEVLRGGKPSEMPYVQATRYELVINLKAAKALGLEIPLALLARADEVIE